MLQCSTYTTSSTSSRCQNDATLWLIAPDGERVPGCYVCESHAQKILAEYEFHSVEFPELAGWTAQPIDEYGRIIEPIEEEVVPLGE